MKKKIYLISVIVLIVGLGAATYAISRHRANNNNADSSQSQQNPEDKQNDTSGEAVTKAGTFGCLVAPGGGPQTLECAFGLTEEDGTSYGLQANDPAVLANLPTDQKIEVTGTLRAPKHADKYQTAGTIEVTSVRKL